MIFLLTFRFTTMDANVDQTNSSKAKMMVDFKYFIQSATEKKLPWNTLVCFLTDLAPTLDKSKEIIRILVQELEKWVSKVEAENGKKTVEVSENSIVIEEQENSSNDTENCDFVENFEMYLENEISETKANELPQNTVINTIIENHKDNSNKEEIKSYISKKDRNSKRYGNKNFVCDFCHKSFKAKQTLKRHQSSHTGEKPFECKLCAKKFSFLHNLKVHEKIHISKKNFECDVCHKSFKVKAKLQRHQQIHTGEKPYDCKFCNKKFSQPNNLKVHERRRHTGEKPFKCSKCKKTYAQSRDLKNHQRTHTGEKPFQCKVCEKTFSIISNLKAHQRKFHSH